MRVFFADLSIRNRLACRWGDTAPTRLDSTPLAPTPHAVSSTTGTKSTKRDLYTEVSARIVAEFEAAAGALDQ